MSIAEPSWFHWFINPNYAIAATIWRGADYGDRTESAYQEALRRGFKGTREDFAIAVAGLPDAIPSAAKGIGDEFLRELYELKAAAQGATGNLASVPGTAAESLNLASADPWTDAALGAIRLVAIVGAIGGVVWLGLRIYEGKR